MGASASPARSTVRLGGALWWSLLSGLFLLPYWQGPWWSFPASTAALGALFAWRFGRLALHRAGLRIRPFALVLVALLAALLWALFRFTWIPAASARAGLEPRFLPFSAVWVFLFQTLNEEVVLGYLPLNALTRRFGRPVIVAIGVAVLFAFLHVVLYRGGAHRVWLPIVAVWTLVLVGVVRNAAILAAGHVGYAWALHAAWNLVMFGGTWRRTESGEPVSEPELLAALLGDPWTLAASAGAAVLATIWLAAHCAEAVRPPRSAA